MTHGMSRDEAAAVRMLANPALSDIRRFIVGAVLGQGSHYRADYLKRVAARYARLLAAREGERG